MSEVNENVEQIIEENPLAKMIHDDIVDSQAIDVEAKEIPVEEEETKEDYITVKTATPLNIHHVEKDGKEVATIVFLCLDGDNKLFTLSRNYEIRDEYDMDNILEDIPFAIDYNDVFISSRICNNYLVKYLDNYVINMEFAVESDYTSSADPKVAFVGINSKTMETKEFMVNAEIWSAIDFIDNYITSSDNNIHDLTLACTIGSKPDKITKFFKVDDIDDIVSMAPVVAPKSGLKKLFDKNDNTTIGLVLKVSRIVNGEKEYVYILTPFDIGKSFDISKFKGDTIEKIQDTYYGDSDQYVSTLLVDNSYFKIQNEDGELLDKEYMTIRGKSKDHNTYVFLFDTYLKDKIVKMIEEY